MKFDVKSIIILVLATVLFTMLLPVLSYVISDNFTQEECEICETLDDLLQDKIIITFTCNNDEESSYVYYEEQYYFDNTQDVWDYIDLKSGGLLTNGSYRIEEWFISYNWGLVAQIGGNGDYWYNFLPYPAWDTEIFDSVIVSMAFYLGEV